MEIFLWILLTLAGLIILAFLLPLRIYINAAGGTDKGFNFFGKVMIFSGLIGGGLFHCGKVYRVSIFLYTWRILDVDLTSIIAYFRRKAKRPEKARKKEKIEKKEDKKPLVDRLKAYHSKTITYWGYFKEGFHDFCEIIRFDHFSADVTLGLVNPAVTGWITGIIFALNNVLPESCVITPSWDFTHPVLRCDVSITITFISLKFWKNVIRHLPEVLRKVIKRKDRTSKIIIQEV